MSFDVKGASKNSLQRPQAIFRGALKQMPASSNKNLNEDAVNVAKLQRFKIGFVGIVLVCLCVIVGSAIFYYQLGY